MTATDTAHCTGPLRIDAIPLAGGGLIGLTNCPGRNGTDSAGRVWQRTLADDLGALERWGASLLVTLIERKEFATLGVPDFPAQAEARNLDWRHIPVPDMGVPDLASAQDWHTLKPRIVAILRDGGRVAFHCAAGLGRTGSMVARLLVEAFDLEPDEAIRLVRSHRPGAIESDAQVAFVRAARDGASDMSRTPP